MEIVSKEQRKRIDAFVKDNIKAELDGSVTTRLARNDLSFDGRTVKITEVTYVWCLACSKDPSCSAIDGEEINVIEDADGEKSWYAGIWKHLHDKHPDLFKK